MRSALLTLLLIFAMTAPAMAADEMSIDEAYRAIPHKQTPFTPKQSRLEKTDAEYLNHYFFVADLAMRAKVMTWNHYGGARPAMSLTEYNKEVGNAIASFKLVNTPRHLKQAEALLISAIRDQQAYFNTLEKAKSSAQLKSMVSNFNRDRNVLSAHQKLIKAYMILKRTYPKESAHNQSAFFDHLCALDFI